MSGLAQEPDLRAQRSLVTRAIIGVISALSRVFLPTTLRLTLFTKSHESRSRVQGLGLLLGLVGEDKGPPKKPFSGAFILTRDAVTEDLLGHPQDSPNTTQPSWP